MRKGNGNKTDKEKSVTENLSCCGLWRRIQAAAGFWHWPVWWLRLVSQKKRALPQAKCCPYTL